MTTAMEQFGLPAGRYPARLDDAKLVEPDRRRAWQLRLDATVQRNGAQIVVWQSLAERGDDPFALPAARRKRLRQFAAQLGVESAEAVPTERLVGAIMSLAADHAMVNAHVRPSPMGMAVSFHQWWSADGSADDVVDEPLDVMPAVETPHRQATDDAQSAHQQLLIGLHHANRGLALVAEACWALAREDGWVALGYDSIGQYLASPEVAMSRSQFYRLADIWQQYVADGGVDAGRLCAPSKLVVPLAALKAGEVSANDALADAEALGLRDLRAKYGDGDDPAGERAEKVTFPFACRACGVLIENTDGVVSK